MKISILTTNLKQLLSMIFKDQSECKGHIKKALHQMNGVNKWQSHFIVEVLILFLSIKGRLNFLQLSRHSQYNEQRFRNQFNKPFDFLNFNKELLIEHASQHVTIAFDPSYISKSGKATPGVGYFWSGVAGKAKWGLEISGIGAIDIENHTAFHLEAVQTPSKVENLVEYYAQILIDRKSTLHSISKYVVADAYFSKHKFVSLLCDNNFHVVSRLRDDADLMYLYIGKKKAGKGRPKKYAGKIDYEKIDNKHFKLIEKTKDSKVFHGIVYSKSLKREINLIIEYTWKNNKWKHKLYFTTDLDLEAQLVLEYYKTRFQIEFTFRDAKQNTGLNHCQARNKNKLYFHFNTALTAINIAKITHWIPIAKQHRKEFSMAEVKTIYHNNLLLKRFLTVFAINPNLSKNIRRAKEVAKFGARAA